MANYIKNRLPPWLQGAYEATFGKKGGPSLPDWLPVDYNEEEFDFTSPVDSIGVFSDEVFDRMPSTFVGAAPKNPAGHSYFNTPIIEDPDRTLRGRSRRYGDVDPEVSRTIRQKIVESAFSSGLDKEDTALLLAMVDVESGFNPDAAAGSSSASGLGQFINKTGAAYGLTDETRWNVDSQIDAMIRHFQDNKKMAESKGHGREYIYAYHHDGPSLAYGGIDLSKNRVMPLADKYLSALG